MWRALVLLALVGCGGVTNEGMTDQYGCPTDAAGLSCTTSKMPGDSCALTPASVTLVNGMYGDEMAQWESGGGNPTQCTAYFKLTAGGCSSTYKCQFAP